MPKSKDIYTDFADYYDLYAEEYDYDLWFAYLKNLSGLSEYKGKRILDLGCGTGILIKKFAQDGCLVTGVDLSDKMLSIADQALFDSGFKALLINADISGFFSGVQYDFIYSTCDTVNYLNREKLTDLFHNVSNMLTLNAFFTFDVLNFEYFKNISGSDVYNIQGVEYVFDRQITTECLKTKVRIADGNRVRSEEHTQFFLSPEYIAQAAESQNLSIIGIWDIYTKMPPNEDSDKLQILLQKTKIL